MPSSPPRNNFGARPELLTLTTTAWRVPKRFRDAGFATKNESSDSTGIGENTGLNAGTLYWSELDAKEQNRRWKVNRVVNSCGGAQRGIRAELCLSLHAGGRLRFAYSWGAQQRRSSAGHSAHGHLCGNYVDGLQEAQSV